jgi:hypothetical protein
VTRCKDLVDVWTELTHALSSLQDQTVTLEVDIEVSVDRTPMQPYDLLARTCANQPSLQATKMITNNQQHKNRQLRAYQTITHTAITHKYTRTSMSI